MNPLSLFAVLVSFTLTACNAANVQPPAQEGTLQAVPMQTADASQGQSAQFEKLNGRITLMQEQFLELKVQNAAVAERVQLLLTQFQILAQEVKRSTVGMSDPSDAQPHDAEQMAALLSRLDQQLMELQQAAPELGGGHPFQLTTGYTAKGQWVLIRYNRFSGESWISGDNSWLPLADEVSLAISDYEIQLQPANNDVKGYVAARIDHNSGTAWWLNKDRWVLYEQ